MRLQWPIARATALPSGSMMDAVCVTEGDLRGSALPALPSAWLAFLPAAPSIPRGPPSCQPGSQAAPHTLMGEHNQPQEHLAAFMPAPLGSDYQTWGGQCLGGLCDGPGTPPTECRSAKGLRVPPQEAPV